MGTTTSLACTGHTDQHGDDKGDEEDEDDDDDEEDDDAGGDDDEGEAEEEHQTITTKFKVPLKPNWCKKLKKSMYAPKNLCLWTKSVIHRCPLYQTISKAHFEAKNNIMKLLPKNLVSMDVIYQNIIILKKI